MISIIIATHMHGAVLAETLDALVPAAIDGLVREVLIADCGSTDATCAIADGYGADVVSATGGVASALNTALEAAKCRWVLVLPADARLQHGFERVLAKCVEAADGVAAIFPVTEERRLTQAARWLARRLSPNRATERDCLLIGRAALERLGGFETAHQSKGCARVYLRGHRVMTFPGLARRATGAGDDRSPVALQSSWRRRVGKSATQTSVS